MEKQRSSSIHSRKARTAKGIKRGEFRSPAKWLGKRKSAELVIELEKYFSPDGRVQVDRTADVFGMSKGQLAETVGVAPETLQRTSRADAPKTQARLREMLEIVTRVSAWAGGDVQAITWYRAEPIPAFGGRTAEALVKDGKAGAVRDFLDGVALGSFA